MVKKVYLIFKTHLDIGFCDLGNKIVKTYLDTFIPNAIKRGYELKDTDTPYIWTTGSWLINEGLKHDTEGTLDKAIKDGIISWHALPFTVFSESMSPELMEYGLKISDDLDKRYGKKTIAAKMSDVPGHTRAIIPYLIEHGVKFLHLGINTAHPIPNVPEVYRWKYGDDEIAVVHKHNYGADVVFGDFAMAFGHTADNLGPQSKEQIIAIYEDVAKRFPGAEIKAASLNEVTEAIESIWETLPVVDKEICDPWIQNLGTDPYKVSMYKELLRHIERNGISGDISDSLLVIPEHTWGGDVKAIWPDYAHYDVQSLELTRNDPGRKYLEKSWSEKRELIDNAQKALKTDYQFVVEKPNVKGEGWIPVEGVVPDFEISWQLFDNDDYERFFERCITKRDSVYRQRSIIDYDYWMVLDNSKMGLPNYLGGIYTAKVKGAYKKGDTTVFEMRFDFPDVECQGLPEISAERTKDSLTIRMFGQKANRLPQAMWLKLFGMEEKWEVCKIGKWMDTNASYNPNLMATSYGVRNPKYEIECVDSMLVAPHGRHLLDRIDSPYEEDMYFNLYNNIWGCNQPQWYEGNSIFRFVMKNR